MGFFSKLKEGLSKTKNSFDEKINNVFSHFRKVDEELLEELEEALIMSDVGMDTSLEIISNLRDRIKKEKIEDENKTSFQKDMDSCPSGHNNWDIVGSTTNIEREILPPTFTLRNECPHSRYQ